MRAHVYYLAMIVAWPAAAWFVVEAALRLSFGHPVAAGSSLAMAACAGGMIALASLRRRQLAAMQGA